MRQIGKKPAARWPPFGVVSVALLATVVALLVSCGRTEGSPPRAVGSASGSVGTADLSGGDPTSGSFVTLATALERSHIPLYRPEGPSASDASVDRVWVPADGVRASTSIEYASGIRVDLATWPEGKDPADSYRRQWAQVGGIGELRPVDGNPAWVIAQHSQPTRAIAGLQPGEHAGSGMTDPSQASVELTMGTTDIVISGHVDVEVLIDLAGTLTDSPTLSP